MKNNQNKELVLLEDLGTLYPTLNSKHKARYGLYKCYCGNEFKTLVTSVKNGKTKSCGCYQKLRSKECSGTHNLRNHGLYKTWLGMLHRCNNPKAAGYKNYGGRGIEVCERWLKVENFIEDMFPAFQEGLTLDRRDTNGNYNPDNCRWSKRTTQTRNTRKIWSHNTSGYRGVHFDKNRNKWKVQIFINNKIIHLGRYSTAIEAAMTYDNYVIKNKLEHTINGVVNV